MTKPVESTSTHDTEEDFTFCGYVMRIVYCPVLCLYSSCAKDDDPSKLSNTHKTSDDQNGNIVEDTKIKYPLIDSDKAQNIYNAMHYESDSQDFEQPST